MNTRSLLPLPLLMHNNSSSNTQDQGIIFQIQRWSLHDGEGIRTTVFFKGCPLRCLWCANPESWEMQPSSLYGRTISVQDIMAILRKDEIFYSHSGGGVTFSGGEAFAQPLFLRSLAQACHKQGYDLAVETSGFFCWDEVADIIPLFDTIFIDLKLLNNEKHKRFTQQPNTDIKENITRLVRQHPRVIVRIPLIKGINDSVTHMQSVCQFVQKGTGLQGIELLPYHDLGRSKYTQLQLPPPPRFTAPSNDKKVELQAIIQAHGITAIE